MAHAPRIDFTPGAHYDIGQPEARQDFPHVYTREGGGIVLGNQDVPAEITVIFQVLYDTPQGTIRLTVQDYTQAAVEQGVRCQIGHRKVGDIERRSPPLSLEEATRTAASAAALDGEALYLRLIDSTGRDLAATKIDEARWPRDAGPTTVKTVSYWLFVP